MEDRLAVDYTQVAEAFLEKLREVRANLAHRSGSSSSLDFAFVLAERASRAVDYGTPSDEREAWRQLWYHVGERFTEWWA